MSDPLLTRITTDPAILGGKPIIRGQRFAVEHLLDYLAAGMTEAELLAEFPFLKPDDIRAALAHQAASQRLLNVGGKMKFALSWEELRGKNDY